MISITSPKNPIVLQIKKLKSKKYREQLKLFVCEGMRNVNESLKLTEAKMIFLTDEKLLLKECACPVYFVNDKVMKELSDTVTPQGIIGVFEIPEFDISKVGKNIVALNGVSDPGNVGTILRSACAFGFDTIIVDENTADIYSPKVVRSAMSGIFRLNILRTNEFVKTLSELKNKHYKIFSGCLKETSVLLNDVDFSGNKILVMGNEGNGIEKSVLDISDVSYIIPMKNEIESLNVSIAASIVMFWSNK